jgi:hypothetical protein
VRGSFLTDLIVSGEALLTSEHINAHRVSVRRWVGVLAVLSGRMLKSVRVVQFGEGGGSVAA